MTRYTEQYTSLSGLVFYLDPNVMRSDPLPGIDESACKPYKAVFFGAARDWVNDEEGWIRVNRQKRRNKRCNIQGYEYDNHSMA